MERVKRKSRSKSNKKEKPPSPLSPRYDSDAEFHDRSLKQRKRDEYAKIL